MKQLNSISINGRQYSSYYSCMRAIKTVEKKENITLNKVSVNQLDMGCFEILIQGLCTHLCTGVKKSIIKFGYIKINYYIYNMKEKAIGLINKLKKENETLTKELESGLSKFKTSRVRQSIQMNKQFINELESILS